jgi:hypothetical protein
LCRWGHHPAGRIDPPHGADAHGGGCRDGL